MNKRQKEKELATNHSRRALYVAHSCWCVTDDHTPHGFELHLLVSHCFCGQRSHVAWLGVSAQGRARLKVLAGLELLLELWVPCKLMWLVDRNQFPEG